MQSVPHHRHRQAYWILSFPEMLTGRLLRPLRALTGLSLTPSPRLSPADPDNSLSVSIPEPSPLRVLLGTSLTIPCYFIDPMHPVTTAPSTAPLAPRIKWSRISKEKEVVLLVATEGQVRVNSAYQDKVSLPNYPAIPSDATLEIQNLRSNDSGVYRCEVIHGIEDSEATLEVVVKGESLPGDTGSPVQRTRKASSPWLSKPSSRPCRFAPPSSYSDPTVTGSW